MKFFFDACLSPGLAAGLDALGKSQGHEVVHLFDRFERSVADEDWLSILGDEGTWIIISGDIRIYRNVHRRKVWRRTALTTFFLQPAWMKLRYWQQAYRLVAWWPRILDLAATLERGAGFTVPTSIRGRLKPI